MELLSSLSRLNDENVRKKLGVKARLTKKTVLVREALKRMTPPAVDESPYEIVIGDMEKLDPYIVFAAHGSSALCRGNVGSDDFWDDVAAGVYKYNGAMILWGDDRKSWDGFVFFTFDLGCKKTVPKADTNAMYIDLICSKPGYGTGLIASIMELARLATAPKFSLVSLSALSYVTPYYSKLGFVVPQRGRKLSPQPPTGKRFSSFRESMEDKQHSKFINDIKKHNLGSIADGIFMHYYL